MIKPALSLLLCGLLFLAGCGRAPEAARDAGGGKRLTVALLPKSKGNAYFISCRAGAEKDQHRRGRHFMTARASRARR